MRKLAARALAILFSVSGLVAAGATARADELAIGGYAHDTSFGVSGTPHEGGTADIQLLYRTNTLHFIYLFNPMVYAKAQINTSGLTNFYTVGLEWRHHFLKRFFGDRFYGDAAIGGAYVDGYNTYPDHFDPSSSPLPTTPAQTQRYLYDLGIYRTRKAMGSDFVFNPNFSFGYELTPHVAIEGSWDHYSNAGLGGRNPGMDTFGGRVVYHFGGFWH